MCSNCDYTIHRHHHHYGWDNSFVPVERVAPGSTLYFECLDSGNRCGVIGIAADINMVARAPVTPLLRTLDKHRSDHIGFAPGGYEYGEQAGPFRQRQLVETKRRLFAVNRNPAVCPPDYPDEVDSKIVRRPDQQPYRAEQQQLVLHQLYSL